jgi:Zn-dependent alcohol dehydrogenase
LKAAILEKLDSPLTVRDVELTELQFGQVLVKVSVSGICGAQLQEIHGYKNNAKFLPHLIGHEGCGTVEKVGPGVTRVKIGEKVSMHWRQGLGIESDFPKYLLDGKVISSGKLTTLSEYTISSENRLTAIPADTPDELGALLGCGLSTALGVIDNEAEIKFGESIAIIGCGGVGLNLIQAARMKSCSRLIGIDQVDNKSELAKSLGATHFLRFKAGKRWQDD